MEFFDVYKIATGTLHIDQESSLLSYLAGYIGPLTRIKGSNTQHICTGQIRPQAFVAPLYRVMRDLLTPYALATGTTDVFAHRTQVVL